MASDVLSGEEVAVLERLRDLSDHSVNLESGPHDDHSAWANSRRDRIHEGSQRPFARGEAWPDSGLGVRDPRRAYPSTPVVSGPHPSEGVNPRHVAGCQRRGRGVPRKEPRIETEVESRCRSKLTARSAARELPARQVRCIGPNRLRTGSVARFGRASRRRAAARSRNVRTNRRKVVSRLGIDRKRKMTGKAHASVEAGPVCAGSNIVCICRQHSFL